MGIVGEAFAISGFIIVVINIFISLFMFDFGPPPKELLISRITDINSNNLAINTNENITVICVFLFEDYRNDLEFNI